MKSLILTALLLLAPIPVNSQDIKIIRNHPNQWQIPDACLSDITSRIDNDMAEVECKKLIFSTGYTSHNINFILSLPVYYNF